MPGRTRWCRRALVVLVLAVSLGTAAGTVGAQLPPPPDEPQPRAWILVDADTGEVLDARNEHEPLLVASTIKLMTAITALEHLPGETILTVSQRAADRPAFDLNMQPGEEWRLLDVLSAMLIVSANDAAYTLAEGSAGSIEAFADQMTETGERLGLRDSTFHDPAGLDSEFSHNGGSLMSAHDLAIVGRNALAIPAIAERAATEHDQIEDLNGVTRTLPSRNNVFLPRYDGATGLKTGGTDAAGSTFVASATRDGRSLVAVVLDVPDTAAWAGMLLDRGFAGESPGTGTTLPPVRVATVDQTRAALASMPRLLGRPAFEVDPVGGAETTDEPASTGVDGQVTTANPGPAAATGGNTGWLRNIAIGAVLLLVALALLRRRAVMRRRKRRLARQQTFAEARRRGMIDVIDPTERTSGSVHLRRERSRLR